MNSPAPKMITSYEGLPRAARQTVDALKAAPEWRYTVEPAVDSGGAPYVTVIGRRDDGLAEVRASWHTRATGTYRLFSCIARSPGRGWSDLSVFKALDLIEGVP